MVRIKYFPFLILFMIVAIFFILKNKEEKRLISTMENNLQELQEKVHDTSLSNNLELHLSLKQQEQLKVLEPKFEFYTYNGENTWLKHQDFFEENFKDSLLAIVNQEGEISLFSNYIGTEPLVHYAIQLKIGEIYVDSVRVMPAIDQNSVFATGITQVHESIYLKNENAITLLEQIALHKNEEIEVKLIGKNAFTSFILTEKSKQAFSETLELLNLLNV